MKIKNIISLALLVFIPISIAADLLHWGSTAVFVTSAMAILPLAVWLSTATEEIAVISGPSIGGLLNAFFGNATELIIALIILKEGAIDIVKASLTGTILSNLLLVMGLSMFLGGWRYKEQEFQPVVARVNASSMTLAVVAILLPAAVINTSKVFPSEANRSLSIAVSIVLMVVYVLTLVFSLRTHSYLYDVGLVELEGTPEAQTAITPEKDDDAAHKPNLWLWLGVLVISTIGVAIESELLVGALEETTAKLGLSAVFTGVILLPLIGGAAEYITAVTVAMKNNMELSVSVAMGSSLLIALFVAPLLVLVGQAIGQPMDLDFDIFQVLAVAIAVGIANLISLDGRSNWLEGTLLLATYTILGLAFYFHPV
jgi:Ca2+:H+ antiporter